MDFIDKDTKYTRIIEYKNFEMLEFFGNVIVKTHPQKSLKGKEAYYPMNDDKIINYIYNIEHYLNSIIKLNFVVSSGKLGYYQYYNMKKTIVATLKLVSEEMLF